MDFHVYDTTMRDGAQQEGLNLSIQDKMLIAKHLDELGVNYIEGGWPGSNPKDTEFFQLAAKELDLKNAAMVAFGATRRPDIAAENDPLTIALVEAATPVVTIVAKSHDRHVELALKTTLDENLRMIQDTVRFLTGEGKRVFVDLEHFFDGYRANSGYALDAVRAAHEAGAEVAVLCDTNGGMLPDWVSEIVADAATTGARLGIHTHNDTGCAVANSMAAVKAGATHFQGCINGYGERTGNADLITVVANLELKLGMKLLPEGSLAKATHISHAISEITNYPPHARQPYTGLSAFAHKAGLHASAIRVDPDLYQHTDPELVGNDMRLLVSEMAGRASVELKGRELGFEVSGDVLSRVTDRVKELEQAGYTFEAADASFALLLAEEVDGARPNYFDIESWRVIAESGPNSNEASAEATVKLTAGNQRHVLTGEGNGPVNALDHAFRQAIELTYPEVSRFHLTDYRVRILDQGRGTDAITRVLIETSDGRETWVTVGVGPNIIDASWHALVDAVTYGLWQHHKRK